MTTKFVIQLNGRRSQKKGYMLFNAEFLCRKFFEEGGMKKKASLVDEVNTAGYVRSKVLKVIES